MKLRTIGFTQRSAEEFFETLKRAGIDRLIDVRLNNISQLAGYSKKDDLRYFLRSICGIDYDYEPQFRALLRQRKVERTLNRDLFAGNPVLLCSEFEAEHCHRRIVAEYLAKKWGGIEIEHL
jgi:uncharacterized protein (DUF488 family)